MPRRRRPVELPRPAPLSPVREPPVEAGVDAVVAWVNDLNLRLLAEGEQQTPKRRALQQLVSAFGRVKGIARDVELLLKAREQREKRPAAPAYGRACPADDLLAVPLWHALEIVRLAKLVCDHAELDDEDVEQVKLRLQGHVAGVQVREAGETAAFKRRHRIGADVQGAVEGFAKIQAQLEAEALTEGDTAEARDDLVAFGRFMKSDFLAPWHVRRIASALMRLERREIRGLVINVPPRHGKTVITSHLFAAWYLGRHPDHDVIVGCMNATYAEDNIGAPVRNLIQSPEFRRVFPGVNVSADSSAKGSFAIAREDASVRDRRGMFKARGRGAPPTGAGANLLILDDFIDELSAYSATERAKLFDDIYGFRTRLAPGGLWVVINTRYHEDDIVGVVQRKFGKDRNWEVISLPVFAEQDEVHEAPFPATPTKPARVEVFRRRKGEALWPDRDPNWVAELEAFREATLAEAPHKWWGQYMCRPTPTSGALVDIAWFRRYDYAEAHEIVERAVRVFASVDTGGIKFRERAGSARTAITVWAELEDGRVYLVDVEAGAWIYDDLKRRVKEACGRWNPTDLLVEDKAAGVELIDDLNEERDWARTPITAVDPKLDKAIRMAVASPQIRAGQVFVPAAGPCVDVAMPRLLAPWLDDFLMEMAHFPLGSRKDLVDSTSQALNWRRENSLVSNYAALNEASPAKQELMSVLAGPWSAPSPSLRGRGTRVRF